MSVWKRNLLGMLSGAGSVVIKTGLNIVVIPVIIAKLGLDAFGLYILLIAILEVSSLLDLGGTSALVALLGGEDTDAQKRRAYLKVGHSWFSILAIVFALGGLLILPGFSHQFHVTQGLQSVAPVCFLLILLEAAITLYSCYSRSVLLAHCSHQWTNVADTLYYLIANLGALILLVMGYGLPGVLAVRLLGALVRLGLMMWQTMRLEPYAFKPQMPFDWQVLKKVAGLSGHAMMINFSIIISHKIDDIIIASFLPISAVGIYEIVFRFLGITIQVCLKLCEGIFPLFSKMAVSNQVKETRQLFLRMSSFLNMVACLLLMLIVSYYQELFGMFSAGKIPVENTLPVLAVAVPCVLSGVLQMPANTWLFTWGRQRFLTVSSMIAALANLILSLILVHYMGIVGVALGTMIPQIIQHQASLIRTTCQALRISFLQYMRSVHGAIVVPLLVSLLWVLAWKPIVALSAVKLLPICLISASAAVIGLGLWFGLTASPVESQLFKQIISNRLFQPIQMKLKRKLRADNA
ncbi:MAG: polysaccharide biosynthesis protein [Vampirovibrio sp.]|jgi:O-antigen/teichoic acid export membrane protein|nr:polysaccharide biosynthesis protein [Vampirovibrio sp.]